MPKKLSDTATVLITNAATRPELKVLPVPKSLRAPTVVVRKTLMALLLNEMIAEVPAARDDEVWASTDAYGRTTLALTKAGLAAIGIEPEPQETPTKPHTRPTRGKAGRKATGVAKEARGRTLARGGGKDRPRQSKQDAVLGLLRRKHGATVAEMMAATGWQAHSVRGFMSGALKKRLRLKVISDKDEKTGERRYFVAS
jgi:hypothetical protein